MTNRSFTITSMEKRLGHWRRGWKWGYRRFLDKSLLTTISKSSSKMIQLACNSQSRSSVQTALQGWKLLCSR